MMICVCSYGTALPVTASASVTAAPSVETAASVEASAKARLPAGGKASGGPTVIKTAERARTCTATWRREPVLRGAETSCTGWAAAKPAAMKSAAVIEVVAISENSAVGLVMVVVETNVVVMPI
jgi:hypothetical protein